MFDKEQKRNQFGHFKYKKEQIRDENHKKYNILGSIPFTNVINYATS